MWLTYLKVAYRNLLKQKIHSAINVTGLALSIATCTIVFLIVRHETSFDTFREDGDRIYRVYSRFTGAFKGTNPGVPGPTGAKIRNDFSGVESVTAFHTMVADVTINSESTQPREFKEQEDIIVADQDYFTTIGGYMWLSQNESSVFSSPFQVILTEDKARLYFGVEDPLQALGREVTYQDSLTCLVTGVVARPDEKTDFYFSDFISFPTIESSWLKNRIDLDNWSNTNSSSMVFIKLEEGVQLDRIKTQFDPLIDIYDESSQMPGWTFEFGLQSLSDLHFNQELRLFNNSPWSPANKKTLNILLLTALFLLLLAAVNFINLETAKATLRAKEIGIRKTLGSSRYSLIFQYLGEALLTTFLAIITSWILTEFALRFFEEFVPPGLSFSLLSTQTFVFFLSLLIAVSLLAGLYPAYVITRYRPIEALNSRLSKMDNKAMLRKGLIIFQFCIAQFLIVGTLVVMNQVKFMSEKDLGFETDAIVNIRMPWESDMGDRRVLTQKIRALSGVESVCVYDEAPIRNGWSSWLMGHEANGEMVQTNVYRKFGDASYVDFFDLDLLAGRNLLDRDSATEFIINNTYATTMGYDQPDLAIGNLLEVDGKKYPIVGVVADFHIAGLSSSIEPVAIGISKEHYSIGVKIPGAATEKKNVVGNLDLVLGNIESSWNEVFPEAEFSYRFLDETIARFYTSERKMIKLLSTATTIAIIISCMGLFGMISFMTNQRVKEIGIRKVLGATTENIVRLLSIDFVKLILIAILIASPIAWYFTSQWLNDYSYRIDLGFGVFVISGILAIIVALFTVSFKSISAAMANPVNALRDD